MLVKSRKSATRAYRLDVEIIEGMKKTAKREGVSENSLVQDLMAQRVKADSLIRAFPYIILSRRTLQYILGSTNPDGLEIAGSKIGKRNFTLARDLYASLGRELTFPDYLREILDEDAHWFEVEGAEEKPEKLMLRHESGMRWSMFLRSYLASAFEVVSYEKMKMILNESYVCVELPARQHW
jgi:hypothetical protein